MNLRMKYLVVSITLLCSCTANSTEPKFKSIDVDQSRFISSTDVMEITSGSCGAILSFDNYLVAQSSMDGYLIDIVSKSGEIVAGIGKLGRGPNEYIQINNLQKVSDDTFLVFDGMNKSLHYYNVDSIVSGKVKPQRTESIGLIGGFMSINRVCDIANGRRIYDGGVGILSNCPPKRLAIASKGSVIDSFDQFPPYKDTVLMRLAYQSQLIAISPDGRRMAVVNSPWGAILEVFDVNESINLIRRDYIIRPSIEYDPISLHVQPSIADIVGFSGLAATDSVIYAIYYGCAIDDSSKAKIIVYNWDGEVQKVYRTDDFIFDITCSVDGHSIYAVTQREGGEMFIVRYDFT